MSKYDQKVYTYDGDYMISWIIDKRNYIIFGIITILLLFILLTSNKTKEYIKSFEYFDEVITIKLYSDKKVDKIWNGIDKICKKKQENGALVVMDIEKYLIENNITTYLINENGNITAGDHYNNSKYKISLTDNNGKLIDIVYLKNTSMAVFRDSKSDNFITVIGKDPFEAKFTASLLYSKDSTEIKDIAKKRNVEVLWKIDDQVYETDNFKKYTKRKVDSQ